MGICRRGVRRLWTRFTPRRPRVAAVVGLRRRRRSPPRTTRARAGSAVGVAGAAALHVEPAVLPRRRGRAEHGDVADGARRRARGRSAGAGPGAGCASCRPTPRSRPAARAGGRGPSARARRSPARRARRRRHPTISAQRPVRPPTAVGCSQPRSRSIRSIDVPEQLRVAAVGPGPAVGTRRGRSARSVAVRAAGGARRRLGRAGRGTGAGERLLRRVRPRAHRYVLGAGAGAGAVGRAASSSAGTGHLAAGHVDAVAGEQLGHVGLDRGGDQHLLRVAHERREPRPALDVELGEHVVEHEHRLATG